MSWTRDASVSSSGGRAGRVRVFVSDKWREYSVGSVAGGGVLARFPGEKKLVIWAWSWTASCFDLFVACLEGVEGGPRLLGLLVPTPWLWVSCVVSGIGLRAISSCGRLLEGSAVT